MSVALGSLTDGKVRAPDSSHDRIGRSGPWAGTILPKGQPEGEAMGQPRHKRAKKPSEKGLSPEVWEAVGKVLPGIIKAVAALIDAISRLH
jgi:hypothetical protein